MSALDTSGQLTNAVIMFTSDNGHLLGEHRQTGKGLPSEEAFGDAAGYRRALIQNGAVERAWRGVRDADYTYVEHNVGTMRVEMHHRRTDPFQLRNLSGKMPKRQANLAARLDYLRSCAGPTCHVPEPESGR